MSMETLEWLENNTLIGFTKSRGNAWHYREGNTNHYPGAVPVADVERRLFDWTAEERPIFVGKLNPSLSQADAQELGAYVGGMEIPDRKAIVRSDNGHVMGIFADGYQPHQYREWLLNNVSSLLDDQLSIGSAGLLKGGAVAWVSVEMPDSIVTPEGVTFRPNLIATTSFDGSLATTYKPIITNVVCDNTMRAALREDSPTFKVRHSAKSMGKLAEARDALGIIFSVADDFAAEVKELCARDFTDRQFEDLIADAAPYPENLPAPGSPVQPSTAQLRAISRADNKREGLRKLWRHDDRVTPWAGTAFGAWQALNTYSQHEGSFRGDNRAERNMLRTVNGQADKFDTEAVDKIMQLTA